MRNFLEFIEPIRFYSITVRKDFYFDAFLKQNLGLFNMVASGVGEEKFPMEKDYDGEMLFNFYKVKKEIADPKSFFEIVIERGFILPGYKGIGVLWYDWRKKQLSGETKDLPPTGWILSPNKIPSMEVNKRAGIPYLDTVITGKGSHQKFGNIMYSNWGTEKIPEGQSILLLRDLNKKSL